MPMGIINACYRLEISSKFQRVFTNTHKIMYKSEFNEDSSMWEVINAETGEVVNHYEIGEPAYLEVSLLNAGLAKEAVAAVPHLSIEGDVIVGFHNFTELSDFASKFGLSVIMQKKRDGRGWRSEEYFNGPFSAQEIADICGDSYNAEGKEEYIDLLKSWLADKEESLALDDFWEEEEDLRRQIENLKEALSEAEGLPEGSSVVTDSGKIYITVPAEGLLNFRHDVYEYRIVVLL